MNIEEYNEKYIQFIYSFRDLDVNSDEIKTYEFIEKIFNELIEKYSSKFELFNLFFHFDNFRDCSSRAKNVKNTLNVIRVSCGYPRLMYKKLYQDNYLEENKIIKKKYQSLLECKYFNFNNFFLECSVRFTFFHELRHLIQFENKENLFSEDVQPEFSQERHLYEIDADLFAIRYILDFVYDIFEKIEIKTKENFFKIILFSFR